MFMRFRDFVATVIISTCTCLLVVWALISAGIIQTQQQIPQQQPQIIKQTHTGTLTGVYNETSQKFEAYIEKIPIQNVTDKTTIRLIHISLEVNVTNHDFEGTVDVDYLRLSDQNLQIDIAEKSLELKSISQNFLTLDISVNPPHYYFIYLKATGTSNFTLAYDLNIIQEIFA